MWFLVRRSWVACSVLLAVAACSGQAVRDPDDPENKEQYRRFSRTGPTEDALNAKLADREDWRVLEPGNFLQWPQDKRSGKVELRITLGPWGEDSSIEGFVTVFNSTSAIVAERPLHPGKNEQVVVAFDVEANAKYLVRFKAASGKGKYTVTVASADDGCAGCDKDKQECVEGKCVDKPCGGACAANETCDTVNNRCVRGKAKPEDKCIGQPPCPEGQFCVRSTGRCAKKEIQQSKCGPNEVEKGGECVAKAQDLECSIINIFAAGTGSTLTLNCGADKGVQRGASGVVKGVKGATLTISDVYPSRSKAQCKIPDTKLPATGTVVIRK